MTEHNSGNRSAEEVALEIWRQRKRILLISISISLLTLGINFLLPLYYKSQATLLPETDKSKLAPISQLAGVAQLAGVNVGSSDAARLYPAIMNSETILRNVIEKKYKAPSFADSVNLVQFFELDLETPEKNMAQALKYLRDLMTINFEVKTGIVNISLEMTDAKLCADVLNETVTQLDRFMRLKRITNASEQLKWVELRLKEVAGELHSAEDHLKTFREKNRRVGDSPLLLLEQERLVRDVQVKSSVLIELQKQREIAKIEEIKNIAIVNVLDPARPPVKKERPKRATNAAIMFLISIVCSSAYYAVWLKHGEKINLFVGQFKNSPHTRSGV